MRILVTGATGFIGSRLCERLVEEGYDVWGLVRFTSNKRRIPDGIKVFSADLTDPFSVAEAVKFIRPQAVFHLGAITPVSESFRQPKLYMETNYGGTINLAEACRKYCEDLRLFAFASTSEVYGNQIHFPVSEYNTPKPNTPYSISKYAAELYLRNYMHEAYKFPVVVARPFNTYGRALVNQPHFVVEKIIVNMLKGVEKLSLGNPKIERDFMFREDHVNAYLSILQAIESGNFNSFGEAYNFCTGSCISIGTLVETIKSLTGWDGEVVWYTHVRPCDIACLWGDYSKAKNTFNWQPKYDLTSGLKQAIKEWKEVLGL
ncbi:hypothetical protein DRJ19_00590 [Candidatus Woesearchaeota archaeon]|nr:MAG: hypothetical protein DRJ19_00590 [Candidatus Woesearchaeota archaeon]